MNEVNLQRASELISEGQFGMAEQVLSELLAALPDSVRGIALMSDVLAGLRGPREALRYLSEKTGGRPQEPELLERTARYQAAAGDLKEAAQSYRQYVAGHPEDAAQWLALSNVLNGLRLYQESAQACAKAIEAAPQLADGYLKLGEILQQFHSYAQAIEVYQQGLVQIPGHPALQGDLAAAYKDAGQVSQSLDAFKQALVLDPNNAITHYNLATLKSEIGDAESAASHLQDAVRLEPRFAHAYQQLANLDSVVDQDAEPLIERMESLAQDSNMTEDGQARILFGLARMHENRQNYRKAFRACSRANAIRGRQRKFDVHSYEQAIKRHMRVYSSALFRRFPTLTPEEPRVVVIAGTPRSGTTLIDQMLSGHPDIVSIGENDFMTKIKGESVRRFQGQFGYPDSIQNNSPVDLIALRDIWLQQARAAAPNAKAVVDKTLTNYLNVGLFKLMFPDCVIVESVRDWEDVKLSMFFADFADGHEYAFSPSGLRHFRTQFTALMDHWRQLPGQSMIPVTYEQLVSSPAPELASVFSALGLTPHDDMARFHERTNQVRTLSQAQVRQPLSTASVGKHKHYAQYWN